MCGLCSLLILFNANPTLGKVPSRVYLLETLLTRLCILSGDLRNADRILATLLCPVPPTVACMLRYPPLAAPYICGLIITLSLILTEPYFLVSSVLCRL